MTVGVPATAADHEIKLGMGVMGGGQNRKSAPVIALAQNGHLHFSMKEA